MSHSDVGGVLGPCNICLRKMWRFGRQIYILRCTKSLQLRIKRKHNTDIPLLELIVPAFFQFHIGTNACSRKRALNSGSAPVGESPYVQGGWRGLGTELGIICFNKYIFFSL